jgi:hypothetical protein
MSEALQSPPGIALVGCGDIFDDRPHIDGTVAHSS